MEVEDYIQRSEAFRDDYTHNSEITHELMEILNEGELDEALETIDGDIRLFSKLVGELTRLHILRDAYSETVGMKALTIRLSRTETLSGAAEQEDIKVLREYLVRIKPVVIRFDCSELQVMYEEVEKLSVDVRKRNAQQLLSIKTGSLVPADAAKKNSVSIFSRPSTLTLKLPKFHGDLLKWKDFWALFSSRLEKEPGLTVMQTSHTCWWKLWLTSRLNSELRPPLFTTLALRVL